MIDRLIELFLAQRQLFAPWFLPLSGLLLTLGLITNTSTGEAAANQQKEQTINSGEVEIAQNPASSVSIPDGTYLYGQSSQPEQIGQEYIVFEARQGKLIGALYLPQSEFSCFYGTVDSKQMNLTVVNPYDQTAFSHAIARQQPISIAAVTDQLNLENIYESLTYPYTLGLEGYQPLNQLSDNDQRILNTCRDNYQQQVWQ
ncbi:MAG TPA: hypothetical protein DDZ80_04270 [Cyanobacteria bacterium UBA8803]|nr:hypothetical protein [Cyanobacteria bacterium UBA9273]HBL57774.1 hypothetical protein [Cyanobacteria bacterium UBA8803]